MKKTLLFFMSIFFATGFLNAEIESNRYKVTSSIKEFDVCYYKTADMNIIDSKENDDVAITQAFEINKNNIKGELRYSLFTDMGGDPSLLKIQYSMWVMICLNNIAGYEVSSDSVSNFNDHDVKQEFNADFGCTTFIKNPKSDYSKGYKYMMVDFFCRKDQGIVMRAYLFNDMDFIGVDKNGNISSSSPLFSNYHSFKFMEKDKAGHYIEK